MITACVNNVKRYGTGSLSQEASPGADLPSANRGSDTAPAPFVSTNLTDTGSQKT